MGENMQHALMAYYIQTEEGKACAFPFPVAHTHTTVMDPSMLCVVPLYMHYVTRAVNIAGGGGSASTA